MTNYKTVNGTSYLEGTPSVIIDALEYAREHNTRVTVDYGDVKTGESWGEAYDITGYIGRSMGPLQVPLLVHNARSMGGGAMLTHCILSIRHANKRDGGLIAKI
jgi:hypothetical protein